MKKPSLILVGIGIIIIAFLVVQNKQLKGDLSSSKAEAEELNDYIENANQQTVHFETAEVAEDFVSSYFNYTDSPKEEDVEGLVTDEAKDKLSFEDEGQHAGDDDEEVESSVKQKEVYFGEATDSRQEVLVSFNNLIDHNDVTSEEDSYLKLDLVQENDDWVIDGLEFKQ